MADDFSDDFAHAAPVGLDLWGNAEVQGSVESWSDVDQFRVTSNITGRMMVSLAPASRSSSIDPFLRVSNASGTLLAANDNSPGSFSSVVEIGVQAGETYYLTASASRRTVGAYRLSVLGALATGDDYADTVSQASTIALDGLGAGTRDGLIERAGDRDLFRFVAPASGLMTVSQTSLSRVDTLLYAYDRSQRLLASNNNYGGGTDSQVSFRVMAGQVYYVRAAAAGMTNGAYRLGLATALSQDTVGNSFATAADLTLSSSGSASQAGPIDFAGDVDMYRLTATASGAMTIALSAASGSRLDPYLRLYDASGRLLAQNDDIGGSPNSRVVVNVTAGQTYYVAASGYGVTAGRYLMSISTRGTTAPPAGGFQIALNLSGLSYSQQGLARQAADRWQQVILGDLPDVFYAGRFIDDVLVTIVGRSLDGVGGALAQAGPEACRGGSFLPILGTVSIDTADLARMESSGQLLNVLTHEIGHVLGFGIFWQQRGLLSGAQSSDPRFTGPRATAEYNALFGVQEAGVPLEAGGGQGTRLAHWRESSFATELMTGWADYGASPLSRITVASMADLGYQVNLGAADPFVRPAAWLGGYAYSGGTQPRSLSAAPGEAALMVEFEAPASAAARRADCGTWRDGTGRSGPSSARSEPVSAAAGDLALCALEDPLDTAADALLGPLQLGSLVHGGSRPVNPAVAIGPARLAGVLDQFAAGESLMQPWPAHRPVACAASY